MKPLALLLLLCTVALAQPTPAPLDTTPPPTLTDLAPGSLFVTAAPSNPPVMTFTSARYITFTTSKGPISISMETGEVKLPPDLPLSEASRAFWLAVSQAFPEIVIAKPSHK